MTVYANFIARFTPRYGHNPRRDVTTDANLAHEFWQMPKAPCMLKIDPLSQPSDSGSGIPMAAIKHLPPWFSQKYGGKQSKARCIVHAMTMHFTEDKPGCLRPFIVVRQQANGMFLKQALIIGFVHLYTHAIMDLFHQVLFNRRVYLEETHLELLKERTQVGSPRFGDKHHERSYDDIRDKLSGVSEAMEELDRFNGCGFPLLRKKN